MADSAGVSVLLQLVEEPHCGQLRVALQARMDDRLEWLELGWLLLPNRLAYLPRVDVAFELALGDPAVDGPTIDPELTSDAGLRKAPVQKVCE